MKREKIIRPVGVEISPTKIFKPFRVQIFPKDVLKCPECGHVFSHEALAGQFGWVVDDQRMGEPKEATTCSKCGFRFEGRNLLIEQNMPYLVLLDSEERVNNSFEWKQTIPLSSKDFRRVHKKKLTFIKNKAG